MADAATTTTETKTEQQTTQGADKTQATQTREHRPGFDMPPQKAMGVEDDPNYKMQVLLSKRTRKTPAGDKEDGAKKEEKDQKTDGAQAKAEVKEEPKPLSGLATLISEQLKFRGRKDDKADEKATEQGKTDEKKDEKATETKAGTGDKAKEEPKTVVTKRKPVPQAADPMRVAAEAAGAAAGEAVKAAMSKVSGAQPKTTAAEDELPSDYRHDYEVAKYLAASNPKYKDAPQAILNEFARSEDYARRWEEANPGKAFDPNSEDHDEFYGSLGRPWDEHEFRNAEVDMRAEQIAEKKMGQSSAKLRELEERNARAELAPVAAQTINTVAVLLAKHANEAAHDVIVKEGFPKLQESDPITADALVEALDRLSPRIQTAIFVDDPDQRISFDPKKNRDQAEWLRFLFDKEAQYAGQQDERGRVFASRTEYVKLPPEQQARRWYLTADHLISDMVADAVEEVKSRIEKERERGKKVAAALGYVPKESKNGKSDKEATKDDASKTTETKKSDSSTPADTKPVSPSVGGGAKIDDQGNAKKTPHDDLWARTGKILFGR
jgi:hypothetical protein